ncbi:uncharacterized protein L203_101011 [Cryptococcus depauperatus CBS 7841]|uniref:Cytochrome c oxidase assembly protein COX20, mitochondrial n=1 Tax=Cryptococcus depauperatus CBS 7841 TaxID=1295531 RepID=A0A1E3IKZ8_9TREE|nr:hypothetical protein L203_02527 [Cryptococcus depauperatus CBS 7841]
MSSSKTQTPPVNMSSGNSELTPDPKPLAPEEKLSGDKIRDFKAALSRINPKHDFENIGQVPCARKSLLYGIAGGAGLGAVRFLGSRQPLSAGHWAVWSFVAISAFQWETCTRARRKELAQMRTIVDRYPHRHVSNLKKKTDEQDTTDHSPS